ncbi:prolipoprotein diacylglyceryl transferase, partial [Acidimicrobium ferrooxidans]|nr:prolipoprotein diacylglyceryl transferase [Acidimicrobium ferrooxidans]
MSPVLFDLPGLGPVRAWGTLLYLGICLAMWVGSRRMRAAGYTGNHMLYIGTIALVGGILGGKLLYILQYGLAGSTQLTGQGMVSFGGWALASAGVLSYLWLRGLPVAAVADTLAPSLAVGEAVGRVGCFLNGCCYGDLCKLPWGVKFPTLKGEIAVP